MILQIDFSSIYWLVGIGLVFAIAFALNYLLEGNYKTFFLFVMIADGFVVWSGMLEAWTVILSLIISFAIIFYHIYTKRGKE